MCRASWTDAISKQTKIFAQLQRRKPCGNRRTLFADDIVETVEVAM